MTKINEGAGIDASILEPATDAELRAQIAQLLEENAALKVGKTATELPDAGIGQFGKARYGIVLDEGSDAQDIQTVPVQINGFAWQIQRGRYVEVPKSVVGVLNDAITSRGVASFDDNGMPAGVKFRNSRRFPFQNYGMVINEDGVRIKEPMPDSIAA